MRGNYCQNGFFIARVARDSARTACISCSISSSVIGYFSASSHVSRRLARAIALRISFPALQYRPSPGPGNTPAPFDPPGAPSLPWAQPPAPWPPASETPATILAASQPPCPSVAISADPAQSARRQPDGPCSRFLGHGKQPLLRIRMIASSERPRRCTK